MALANRFRWRLAQAAEWRWWKRYLKSKSRDAYLQWKRQYWRDFLLLLPRAIPPNASILDAGCGPAGINIILHQPTVHAIDPLIDTYRSQDIFHESPNVHFHTSTIEDWRGQTCYDTIFCINCINHVRDINRALRNINRLLAPSGFAVISTDVHRFQLLKWLFRLLPADILHPVQANRTGYHKQLEQAGLEVTKIIRVKSGRIFHYEIFICERADATNN